MSIFLRPGEVPDPKKKVIRFRKEASAEKTKAVREYAHALMEKTRASHPEGWRLVARELELSARDGDVDLIEPELEFLKRIQTQRQLNSDESDVLDILWHRLCSE